MMTASTTTGTATPSSSPLAALNQSRIARFTATCVLALQHCSEETYTCRCAAPAILTHVSRIHEGYSKDPTLFQSAGRVLRDFLVFRRTPPALSPYYTVQCEGG